MQDNDDDDLEWRRILNADGPDALYDEAMEEIRRGETMPLRLEDLMDEEA